MPKLTLEQKVKIRDSIFVVPKTADLWHGQDLDALLELTLHQGLSMMVTGEQVKTYKGRVAGLSYVVSFHTLTDVRGTWESEDFNEAVICAACAALGILPEELKPKKRVMHQIDRGEDRFHIGEYGVNSYENETTGE